MARGLRIADAISKSSDPYAEIHLPGNKTINSPTIDKTLSPVWNFQHKHYVNILQKDYKDVKITVRDSDQMAVDDELGFIELNWQHLITEQSKKKRNLKKNLFAFVFAFVFPIAKKKRRGNIYFYK